MCGTIQSSSDADFPPSSAAVSGTRTGDSQLSAGAKAGIGISAAFSAVLVGSLLLFWHRRHSPKAVLATVQARYLVERLEFDRKKIMPQEMARGLKDMSWMRNMEFRTSVGCRMNCLADMDLMSFVLSRCLSSRCRGSILYMVKLLVIGRTRRPLYSR